MSATREKTASTVKLIALSLVIGVAAKLSLLLLIAALFGPESARPLLFPGTGVILAALAYPMLRARYRRT